MAILLRILTYAFARMSKTSWLKISSIALGNFAREAAFVLLIVCPLLPLPV